MADPTPTPAPKPKTLTVRQQTVKDHSDYLGARKAFIATLLGDTNLNAEQVVGAALALIAATPALWPCDTESVYDAVIAAAKRNLLVGPEGYAWLIPYKENDKDGKFVRWIAQYQLGYKGVLQLMRRSAVYSLVTDFIVYENDKLTVRQGTNGAFDFEPRVFGNRGKIRGYVAFAKQTNGDFIYEAMTPAEVDKIRARSKAANSPAWLNDYDRMALKAVIKRLGTHAELSAEDMRLLKEDDDKDLSDEERAARARDAGGSRTAPAMPSLPAESQSGGERIRTQASAVREEVGIRTEPQPTNEHGEPLDAQGQPEKPAVVEDKPAPEEKKPRKAAEKKPDVVAEKPAEKKAVDPTAGFAEASRIVDNAGAATTREEVSALQDALNGAIDGLRIGTTHATRASSAIREAFARVDGAK